MGSSASRGDLLLNEYSRGRPEPRGASRQRGEDCVPLGAVPAGRSGIWLNSRDWLSSGLRWLGGR